MKGSCILVASVLAASTVSFSSTTSSAAASGSDLPFINKRLCSSFLSGMPGASDVPISSSCKEKFAPRFDGLRFIETLVTAHR